MYIVIFNEVSNQIETQGQKVEKKMENLGTTMIKNQNRVYIHSNLKRGSLHCGIKLLFHLQFVNYKGWGEGIKLDYTCLIMSSGPIKSLWLS